jgi:hypothetical protein
MRRKGHGGGVLVTIRRGDLPGAPAGPAESPPALAQGQVSQRARTPGAGTPSGTDALDRLGAVDHEGMVDGALSTAESSRIRQSSRHGFRGSLANAMASQSGVEGRTPHR